MGKIFAGIFFAGTFFADHEKNAKIARIEPAKI